MYVCITASRTRQNVGTKFYLVYQELIGLLWFAIGRSHVSDMLSRPHTSKHDIREEMGIFICDLKMNERLLGLERHDGE